MAHKMLIGGTGRDTVNGRCLVGGTGYNIFKGRTLIGGTGYDIMLKPDTWQVWSVESHKTYSYEGELFKGTKFMLYRSSVTVYWYSATMPTLDAGVWVGMTQTEYPGTIPEYDSSNPQYLTFTDPGFYCFIPNGATYSSPWGDLFEIRDSTNYFKLCDEPNESNEKYVRALCNCYRYTVSSDKTYSKGSTRYDDVVAPSGTYPDNGKYGDYWYVKVT